MSADSPATVAAYRRTVTSPMREVWENVLDWEHLPWLHRTTFSDIKLLESGPWGWRARVGLQPAEDRREVLIDLRIDRPGQRYVTRTVEGPGEGAEIWTHLAPDDPACTRITVEFRVPGIDPGSAAAVGEAYTRLYAQLWDEDEAMMTRRGSLRSSLRSRPGTREPLRLGTLQELRKRLPLIVEMGGRPFRIVEIDRDLVAHSTICAHRLGPLDHAEIEDGCVQCPWHGHRFDVRTGRSTDGSGLKLLPAPQIRIDSRSIVHLANGSS